MHLTYGIFAGIVAGFGLFYFLARRAVIVYEYERGLKYRRGKFIGILPAGKYWIFSRDITIQRIDIRPKTVAIPGQEILSADAVALKVSVTSGYAITDPDLAVNKIENYAVAFYTMVQLAVREIIGTMPIDEILKQRASLNEKLMNETSGKAAGLGLKIQTIGIKDIMFPGELKKLFTRVVEAKQEGLAALERARGESAALRNLANAAKVLVDNPGLLQLRALQTTGNTIVIGVGGPVVPVQEKKDD